MFNPDHGPRPPEIDPAALAEAIKGNKELLQTYLDKYFDGKHENYLAASQSSAASDLHSEVAEEVQRVRDVELKIKEMEQTLLNFKG